MTRALISVGAVETRLLILDGVDRPLDAHVERAGAPPPAGAIALGRVTAVDRTVDAVFVEAGCARDGLLPRGPNRDLSTGDRVPVRVRSSPPAGKGPKLARADDGGDADRGPPVWLHWPDVLAEVLSHAAPERIVVEGAGAVADIKRRVPALAERVAAHTGATGLFDGEDADMAGLAAPDAPLPGGGRLRIEPVTSMTAVDVDTGGGGGRAGSDDTAMAQGIAAAGELARQIRLRALSGLIVADFPPVERREGRRRVTQALMDGAAHDPVGLAIEPMRASGLVEITRQRTRPPLHEVLCQRCGDDAGGWQRTPVTLALSALRTLEPAALAHPAGLPRIAAAPDVVAALYDGAAAERAAAEARLGRPIAVTPDPALGRDSPRVEMADS